MRGGFDSDGSGKVGDGSLGGLGSAREKIPLSHNLVGLGQARLDHMTGQSGCHLLDSGTLGVLDGNSWGKVNGECQLLVDSFLERW